MISSFSIISTLLAGVVIAAVYCTYKQIILEARIDRHPVLWPERKSDREDGNILTIPHVALDDPMALRHEKCSIAIPNYTISDRPREHFTSLLRHMTCSTQHPLFEILVHIAHEQHVDRLDFVEGDLVSKYFRIFKRSPMRVEFSMEKIMSDEDVAGLLVLRLDVTATKGVSLILEMLEWNSRGNGFDLPSSHSYRPYFLCDLGSAALLVSGADFLGTTSQASKEIVDEDDFVIIPPMVKLAD